MDVLPLDLLIVSIGLLYTLASGCQRSRGQRMRVDKAEEPVSELREAIFAPHLGSVFSPHMETTWSNNGSNSMTIPHLAEVEIV